MSVSTATAYRCCNDERLAAVRSRDGLNGIEAIELIVPPGEMTELPSELNVIFVKAVDVIPSAESFRIVGGSAHAGLSVASVRPTHDPRVVHVALAAPGDLTTYEMRLVDSTTESGPPAGIDPVLARCQFSFAVVCESEVDCLDADVCPPTEMEDPRIDRLARDYPGFHRLLLDRLAVKLPEWRRRNPADVRLALVEVLAYLGDQLSYEQDAVATEAYLGTARSRISIRRHARLVDYDMHDGLSARAFLQLAIGAGLPDIAAGPTAAAGGTFMTAPVGQTDPFDASTTDGRRLLDDRRRRGDQVFHIVTGTDAAAAVAPSVFSPAHNRMRFHTWSGDECCLPVGATQATLAGSFPALAAGDILVLAEHRDPQTGAIEDANPARRHPVRLTNVDAGTEALPLVDPATDDPITEITWDDNDALPATLIVSVEGHDDVAEALGNIVLVEHGAQEPHETLPVPNQSRPWRPRVAAPGLSQSGFLPDDETTARAMLAMDPAEATAAVSLTIDGVIWTPAQDLVGVGDLELMVAEVDNDLSTTLRFGMAEPDGTFRHGRPPAAGVGGVEATLRYRTGIGPDGNVGAGAIRRIVHTGDPANDLGAALAGAGVVTAVTNPLPAWGGTSPETIEHVRQNAPYAFNVQERAVTADDYARRAEQFRDAGLGGVQRAIAQLRWTGAWYTVFIAVDRSDGQPVDEPFEAALRAYLDRYRMAGHDVEIEGAVDIPLEVRLEVQLTPGTFRSVAMKSLRDALSNRRLPDRRLGLFHPDRLTFAQTVYLSPILAEAQGVAGVVGVWATRFGPYRRPGIEARESGLIEVGRNEIARLDNDPSRPDLGVLGITLIGGR